MKKYSKIVVLLTVVFGVLYLIYNHIDDNNSLEKNGTYLIGEVNRIGAASGGQRIYVRYAFKGYKFQSDYIDENWETTRMRVGKYLFLIDSTRPSSYKIIYKYQLPDSLFIPVEMKTSVPRYLDSVLFHVY